MKLHENRKSDTTLHIFVAQQELHVLLYKHVTFSKLVAGATKHSFISNGNKAL